MIIVSACLAGVKCSGDGSARPHQKVIDLVKQGGAIPVCPEQLGGLPTPRAPAELKDNKVYTKDGRDVTSEFKKGAEEALKIALLANCKEAILKSKSPSCGSGKIYDGTFCGKVIEGNGIFVELLKVNDIKVFSEEEIP
jgi:uncharacterized protein YbbK (DUF523 family)